MVNIYKPPFAPTPAVANTGYDAAAVTALQGRIAAIKALFTPAPGTSPAHPDFGQLPAATAAKIGAELDAMSAEITPH